MKAVDEKIVFIVRLSLQSDLSILGKLLNSRARVAVNESHIWLRYNSDAEHVADVASCINGRHFRLLEDDLMVPLGASVATERLPELEWQELAKLLEFKLPTAALSGRLSTAELPELKLLRGGAERTASAGLYALEDLVDWVIAAPQFRLKQLAACVAEGEVLVIGNPLPPLPCQILCQDGRLLTPAGMTWYPRIDAELVLEHFDVAEDQLLLWTNTDQWSLIPIEAVQPLRRASIRAFVDERDC